MTLSFGEKITGLSRTLFVLLRAKIKNCHRHFCKFTKIVTATFRFSRAFFWLFCHGQLFNFHRQNLGFFVTDIFSKSRALFQKVSRANRKMCSCLDLCSPTINTIYTIFTKYKNSTLPALKYTKPLHL